MLKGLRSPTTSTRGAASSGAGAGAGTCAGSEAAARDSGIARQTVCTAVGTLGAAGVGEGELLPGKCAEGATVAGIAIGAIGAIGAIAGIEE